MSAPCAMSRFWSGGTISSAPWFFCALLATVFAFLAQMVAQKVLSPTHTAVVFCLEPVFAVLWSTVTVGERLPRTGYIGAGLILATMLLGQFVTTRCRLRVGKQRPQGEGGPGKILGERH